jgi:hypothetical protein
MLSAMGASFVAAEQLGSRPPASIVSTDQGREAAASIHLPAP